MGQAASGLPELGTVELAMQGKMGAGNSVGRGMYVETVDCTLGQCWTVKQAANDGNAETDSCGLGMPEEADCRELHAQFFSGL